MRQSRFEDVDANFRGDPRRRSDNTIVTSNRMTAGGINADRAKNKDRRNRRDKKVSDVDFVHHRIDLGQKNGL